MSDIYSPGSIAGPQGPAGPAGSQGSVVALASAVIPGFVGRNLFDASKVTAATQVNAADGTLSVGGQPTDATGLIYCPGATSMISNLIVNANNWGAGVCLYDANGNFISALAPGAFSSLFNTGAVTAGTTFALPGTQVYVRFGHITSWENGVSNATGMVYAAIAGTAALPGSYQAAGLDTTADVDAKIAATTANFTPMLALLEQATQAGPVGSNRNGFDYTKAVPNTIVNPDGTLGTSAGFSTATLFAPNTTSFITNIPIWLNIYSGGTKFCTYDVNGNFLEDITPILAALPTQNGKILANTSYPLPGNQTYVKFSWNGSFNSYGWPGSIASCVFYSGTTASPPPALTALNANMSFPGNAPVTVKTATQLGAVLDQSVDATAVLNAFLATASPANPVKLILDGWFAVTGLVISPNGCTTIEGIGAGSGITMIPASNQDAIRIGAYTAATGQSEGAYNIAPPARTATDIILRDFTIDANGAGNTTGGGVGITPANAPVAGAPAHSVFGAILANCTGVLVDNVNFREAPAFALTISNANFIDVRGCTFVSTGTLHDGVHIDGKCEDIAISDCYFSTGDDAIALNAPEGYGGDISRVTVTNCRFNGSLTVLRAYTSVDVAAMPANNVHKVRNVVVSNCTGWTASMCFNLGITNGGLSATTDAGQIQDLAVSNCTLSSPLGLAYLLTPIGSLTFSDVKFIPTTAAPVITCLFSSVGEVVLRGVRVLRNGDGNAAPASVVFIYGGVALDRVTLADFAVVDQEGASYAAVPCMVDNEGGSIAVLRLDSVDMTHVTAVVAGSAAWTGVTSVVGGVIGTGATVPDSAMGNNALYLSSDAGGAPSIKIGGTAKRLALA